MSKTKTKKLSKRKAGKRKRLPVYEAEVCRLGYKFENLDDANAALKKQGLHRPLKNILEEYPRLQRAWDRGQFLRNLKAFAKKGFSVSKAAKKLGLASGQVLQKMIDEDVEVEDVWKQAKFQVYIGRKEKERSDFLADVRRGDPEAIRKAERFLLGEKARGGADISRITIIQLSFIHME